MSSSFPSSLSLRSLQELRTGSIREFRGLRWSCGCKAPTVAPTRFRDGCGGAPALPAKPALTAKLEAAHARTQVALPTFFAVFINSLSGFELEPKDNHPSPGSLAGRLFLLIPISCVRLSSLAFAYFSHSLRYILDPDPRVFSRHGSR